MNRFITVPLSANIYLYKVFMQVERDPRGNVFYARKATEKSFLLKLSRFISAIKVFLNADTHHFCRKLLVQILASLWQIQHFARNQRRLRLYATSVLLVYDARRLREHVEVKKAPKQHSRPPFVRHRSLYRYDYNLYAVLLSCLHVEQVKNSGCFELDHNF